MLSILKNKYVKLGIKAAVCAWIIIFIIHNFYVEGLSKYYSFSDYDYGVNDISESLRALDEETEITQKFISKGNILNNISLYIGQLEDKNIEIAVRDNGGRSVCATIIKVNECKEASWNRIALDCKGLNIDEEYTLNITCEEGLSGVCFSYSTASEIYGECSVGGETEQGVIAVGFEFTHEYMGRAGVLELIVEVFTSVIMTFVLCFSVVNVEILYEKFNESKVKKGLWYSIYFSTSFVLLYNPLEKIRNEVIEFKSVIGAGINSNVDVSRRISNFNTWFIMFAVSFCLFYLFFNYMLQKKADGDNKKVIGFMDNGIVVANCLLVLKIVTFFYNDAYYDNVYVFSNVIVMTIILALFGYVILDLQKNISLNEYVKLLIIGASVSYTLSILVGLGGDMDKVLAGVLSIIYIGVILWCKLCKGIINIENYKCLSTSGVVIFATLPFMTSAYIELIHILNQHSIFVAHPAKYYVIANVLMVIIAVVLGVLLKKDKIRIVNWKKWSYPVLVIGISCLSIQIPLQAIYDLDVFEGANYSILISDFLNHGSIPLVEHYGGHMMTGVWEGILYGVINNDYVGAAVSPYANLIVVLLAVLFFYFIKNIWNEDAALVVTLCFPFGDYWSYYGLGILVCLAIMGYVKKNTYLRALLIWLAFIWCALYRLDLGFAFGAATVISLMIYIVTMKRWEAIKQLGVTLAGCVGVGVITWVVLCAMKGINPISRLYEFVMLSLSNQNWAYASIGNSAQTVFGAYYAILPFAVMICLLYAIFSRRIKENIGTPERIMLIALGISFFINFSRGLVRHSLCEMYTNVIIWTGFVFLAYFVSCYRKNIKLFLPVFMMFMLVDTLFTQDTNFSSKSIIDNSVVYPEPIIESWTEARFEENGFMTYWEKVKLEENVVERVILNEKLNKMKYQYNTVLNKLLDEEETYVDYMNKTVLFSLVERKNPAYVSQSPLQLSGEYTQEQFITQIENVPIIIMPIDPNDYGVSISLDGISNVYRNYLVSEHIYRNYVPLCKYGDVYAVWCLESRYNEYKSKMIDLLMVENEYVDEISLEYGLEAGNVNVETNSDDSVTIVSNGQDPMLAELQNVIDISSYINGEMILKVAYTTDVVGDMQLFYTSEKGENYSGNKVQTVKVSGSGIAEFAIPVTEYTRLRLDIPEGSSVMISSLSTKTMVKEIGYGYDGPYENKDSNDKITYEYMGGLHNYNLEQLPRIWGNQEGNKLDENMVTINTSYKEGRYHFEKESVDFKEKESYLKITATYNGTDSIGLHTPNDENMRATVVLGDCQNDKFVEKCLYTINIKEGTYDYYIRVSADYYWYIGEINSIKMQTEEDVFNMELQILQQ